MNRLLVLGLLVAAITGGLIAAEAQSNGDGTPDPNNPPVDMGSVTQVMIVDEPPPHPAIFIALIGVTVTCHDDRELYGAHTSADSYREHHMLEWFAVEPGIEPHFGSLATSSGSYQYIIYDLYPLNSTMFGGKAVVHHNSYSGPCRTHSPAADLEPAIFHMSITGQCDGSRMDWNSTEQYASNFTATDRFAVLCVPDVNTLGP